MSFPTTHNKYAFLIAGTHHLQSALRDIQTLITILTKTFDFPLKNIFVFSDAPIKLPEDITVYNDLNDIDKLFIKHNLSEGKEPADIFLAISAHGYQEYNRDSTQVDKLDEYFFFNGSKIIDDLMSEKLSKLHYGVKMLALIDTCHSETMLDLHQIKHPGLISISACGDTQSSMQDISDDYGYGGGLVCAFADYLKENSSNKEIVIKDLYSYVYKRLLNLRQHSFLTMSKW